jgi:RimJ/RimL family protein N-acetyltransferase
MIEYVIEICKEKRLEMIFGIMLPDNRRAIRVMKDMGFVIEYRDDDTVKGTLNLREEEHGSQKTSDKEAASN